MVQSMIGVLELAPVGSLKSVEVNGQRGQGLQTVLEAIQIAGVRFNPAIHRILCQSNSGYIFPCGPDRHPQAKEVYLIIPVGLGKNLDD